METANIQSVVENNIVSVALMNIQPSNYNPRKHFDEASLADLATLSYPPVSKSCLSHRLKKLLTYTPEED